MSFNSKKAPKKIPAKIYPVGFYEEILKCYEYESRNPSVYGKVPLEMEFTESMRKCRLTNKEMKITFNEYCRLNDLDVEFKSLSRMRMINVKQLILLNSIILKQTFAPGIQIPKILVLGGCGLMDDASIWDRLIEVYGDGEDLEGF